MGWNNRWPGHQPPQYADQGIGQQRQTATSSKRQASATPGSLQHHPGEHRTQKEGAAHNRP